MNTSISYFNTFPIFFSLHICKTSSFHLFSFAYFIKNPFGLQYKFVKRKGFMFYYKDL